MPGADTKIMTFVKEAADRFSMLAASVEELSVPMHFDGEVFVPICSFFFLSSLFLLARSFANDEIVFHCIHPQEFEYAMRFAWKVVIGYSMVSCQIVSLSSILMFEIKEM